jgi:cysteine desulfurase
VHSDASQLMAWGALSEDLDLDLVTVSGHKMHGPQGTGALIVSRRARRSLRPLLPGGGQERGVRSGTSNVAGIVGLGVAADLAVRAGPAAAPGIRRLRDLLHEQLAALLPFSRLNGHPQRRLPNVLNLALGQTGDEVDAQAVLAHVPRLAASTGSACSAGTPEPSPVLRAMGLGTARAASSIRLSLSRLSEESDVRAAVPLLAAAVLEVRQRQVADRQRGAARRSGAPVLRPP